MDSELDSGLVTEMVSEWELEMASGMLSDSKLIGHICFEGIHVV